MKRFFVQFFSLLSMLVWAGFAQAGEVKNIDNDEVKALLEQGVVLVDIRTEGEWKQTGVIKGSKLLPFLMSNGRPNPKFVEDMARIAGPKDKVMLICRSGSRSHAASDLLSNRFDYEGIHNVRYGMKHWVGEKNQTVKVNLEDMKNTCSTC